jgi:hypothetical protein
VVIADRGSSNADPLVKSWNKMALHALSLQRPHSAFEPLRQSMSKYLHSPITSREVLGKAIGRIPKIVYIDRQDTSRHLVPGDQKALVGFMRGMESRGEVEFVHGRFGGMGLREQIESVLDADVRPLFFLLFSSPSLLPLILLQYLLLLPNQVVLLFSGWLFERDVPS